MNVVKFVLTTAVILTAAGCNVARSETSVSADKGIVEVQPSPVETPVKAQKPAANLGVAEETPEAVLTELYKVHAEDFKANRDRLLDGKNRKALDKFFDKNLAGLIWKDLTTHKDEVGVIDFDLIWATQDPNVKNVKVGPAVIKGDTATDIVTFTNYNQKEKLTYTLVKENGSWKISDIDYGKGETLLKMFKEDQS